MNATIWKSIFLFVAVFYAGIVDANDKILEATKKVMEVDKKTVEFAAALTSGLEVLEKKNGLLAVFRKASDATSDLFILASSIIKQNDSLDIFEIANVQTSAQNHFSELEQQLQGYSEKNTKVSHVLIEIRDRISDINSLKKLKDEFFFKQTKFSIQEFSEQCVILSPLRFCSWIEDRTVESSLSGQLVGTDVFTYVEYESINWKKWVTAILAAYESAMFLRIECVVATGGDVAKNLQKEKEARELDFKNLLDNIIKSTETFQTGFKEVAVGEIQKWLEENTGEHDQQTADQIINMLNSKYEWLLAGAITFTPKNGDDSFLIHGNVILKTQSNGQKTFITWKNRKNCGQYPFSLAQQNRDKLVQFFKSFGYTDACPSLKKTMEAVKENAGKLTDYYFDTYVVIHQNDTSTWAFPNFCQALQLAQNNDEKRRIPCHTIYFLSQS